MRVDGVALVVEGDDADTDVMYPGAYLNVEDPEQMAQCLFEGFDPTLRERLVGHAWPNCLNVPFCLPATSADDRLPGLSRRRSRVRVPSLPLLFKPFPGLRGPERLLGPTLRSEFVRFDESSEGSGEAVADLFAAAGGLELMDVEIPSAIPGDLRLGVSDFA